MVFLYFLLSLPLEKALYMKKFFIYASIILFTLICISVIIVVKSVVHVQLPHGAVMHVLPALKNNQDHGAVIICPGGGYGYLAKKHEGYMWLPFFYMRGYTVALLEYRMPNHDSTIPMTDGAEAVETMRKCAKEWHLDAHDVGIVGFSAGGHLASTMMVTDNDAARPDFGILFYPVISMKKELTHQGSHDHLLGENASEELENRFSSELHVSYYTPPAYIALLSDDSEVKPQNAIRFKEEMCAKNRPVTLHIYPSDRHGWGYRLSFPYHKQMLDDLEEWLKPLSKR